MAEEMNRIKVPKRILNTLLASLTAGVVPRTGAPYIAIGRKEEIATLLDDFSAVGEGGAACRFLIGRYGSFCADTRSIADFCVRMPTCLPSGV